MKLSVIALDYDGTVARGDVLDPAVREAIALARTQGIIVLLVTGRILDELRRVAGDLHFVDGVIAENGAVIHFPDSGRASTLAPLVPEGFIAKLRRRGIPFSSGQCLIDAYAKEASLLLEVIRTLELPLVLIFNRGRVMTAPQGVSKATGLLPSSFRPAHVAGRTTAQHRTSKAALLFEPSPGAVTSYGMRTAAPESLPARRSSSAWFASGARTRERVVNGNNAHRL